MTLRILLLLVAVCLATSLAGDKRLTCSCLSSHAFYRQLDITCVYETPSTPTSAQRKQPKCSKEVSGYVPRAYEYLPGVGLYRLFRAGRDYKTALSRCQQDDAFLAIPKSAAEAQFIAAIMRNGTTTDSVFVGINDTVGTGVFSSIEGTPMSSLGYAEWSPGQPDLAASPSKLCVTINKEGLYGNTHCDSVLGFVCQRLLSPRPPDDYMYIPQHGFYKHYSTPRNYTTARQRCLDDGGHLVVPDTEEEFDELYKAFGASIRPTYTYVGFNNLELKGAFVSETGKPMSQAFVNWYPSEPNNNGGAENCISIYVAGTYNDYSCNAELPFICEIELPKK